MASIKYAPLDILAAPRAPALGAFSAPRALRPRAPANTANRFRVARTSGWCVRSRGVRIESVALLVAGRTWVQRYGGYTRSRKPPRKIPRMEHVGQLRLSV